MKERIIDILTYFLPMIITLSITTFIVYKFNLSVKLWTKLESKIQKEYMYIVHLFTVVALQVLVLVICDLLVASLIIGRAVSFGFFGIFLALSPTQYINSKKNDK